jgi:hypothetical protein
MATLIPDTPKECSFGARLVYEKLGRDLDDATIILHSVGLPGLRTNNPRHSYCCADRFIMYGCWRYKLEVYLTDIRTKNLT